MKSFTGIALLAALLWASTAVAQNWQWQNPLPQSNMLKDVAFTSASTGWAVGDRGIIIHTTDGGQNWHHQESGQTSAVEAVYFRDEQLGFAAGGESG